MTRVTKYYKKTFEEASGFVVTPLVPPSSNVATKRSEEQNKGGRGQRREGRGKPYGNSGGRRGEQRRLDRQQSRMDQTICFRCRKTGHAVADCPEATEGEGEEGKGKERTGRSKCYHCGSTQHSIKACHIPKRGGTLFQYAECFVCKGTGHLASSCPSNTKGLYPNGGGCRYCGSVEHLAKDCKPTSFNADQGMALGKIDLQQGGDDDDVFLALHRMEHERDGRGRGGGGHGEEGGGRKRVSEISSDGTRVRMEGKRKKKNKVVNF